MKARLALVIALALIAMAAPGFAQQPGEIFGKVADASGAVMPGVTVTLSGPRLLQPMTAVSSATGTYRFPGLAVGTYAVKFELAGFKTFVRDGIRVEIAANVQINAALEISTVQETVTVSGATPVVDLRDTSKTSRFTQETLQSIPSARDPWVIIEQAAGVAMDRQNVGGSASGQQSNFVARGAAMSQQKWNLDGVDITDMNATGGSPVYFDFDSFEEMQISAGGADVTMQSPGVGVNLVTKSGTDRLKGSGRFYVTDEKFQAVNVTDELRQQGAATGNPIQNIKDYGIEMGGPIKKGRAWFWGSIGKQNVNVGINNFYKSTPECLAMKATPLNYSIEQLRGCLNTDQTLLNNYNAKIAVETFKNNQFSFLFNGAEKVRNARDASDLRPEETTYRQMGVTRADLGSSWWKTGMPKTYKWSDRHIISDRWMVEGSYAHVGNNFALTFHDESLRDVQPLYETTTQAWARSYQESVYVRPTDSIDLTSTYFLPGVGGGDHAFKFGFKYRNDGALTQNMYGGDAYARVTNGAPVEAQIYRRGNYNYELHNRNFYVQDTYSRKKLTIIGGLRYDYQTDAASATGVDATPFYGQPTYAGVYGGVTYTGAAFNQLPALSFGGKSAGVPYKTFSPRVGITYDLTGNGRNVVKFNYAKYVEQLGSGGLAYVYNTVTTTYVRYPWVDVNGDKFVQTNEVVLKSVPLSYSSGYDYNNPSKTTHDGQHRPEPDAEPHRRDPLQLRPADQPRLRGERQLHLAEVRELLLVRYAQLGHQQLQGGPVDAGRVGLPGGRVVPGGHLLRADQPAAGHLRADQPARLLAQLLRLRAVRPQADVEELDDERELLVQRRPGALHRGPGLRGSDQHHVVAQRRSVRAGVDVERPRQRVRQRQVDLPPVGRLHAADLADWRRRPPTTPAAAIPSSARNSRPRGRSARARPRCTSTSAATCACRTSRPSTSGWTSRSRCSTG